VATSQGKERALPSPSLPAWSALSLSGLDLSRWLVVGSLEMGIGTMQLTRQVGARTPHSGPARRARVNTRGPNCAGSGAALSRSRVLRPGALRSLRRRIFPGANDAHTWRIRALDREEKCAAFPGTAPEIAAGTAPGAVSKTAAHPPTSCVQ